MNSTSWKYIQIQDFDTNWYFKKNRFAFSNRFIIIDRILSQFFPKIILDVGTADGEMPLKLLATGKLDSLFIGVDISSKLIKIATKLAKKNNFSESLQFVMADLEHLPFRKIKFDTIICTAVLEHIMNLDHALNEMARVCKMKKFILITIPNSNYQKVFQLLAVLGLRYRDSVYNLKLDDLELKMVKNKLIPIYRLIFVLPIPNFLKFIEKFLIRVEFKRFHFFLNQLLICKKE